MRRPFFWGANEGKSIPGRALRLRTAGNRLDASAQVCLKMHVREAPTRISPRSTLVPPAYHPMTYLLALLAGIAGAALGWFAAAALTIFIGGVIGISDFEGGRGMLAVWGIGPLGGLAGLLLGIILVLRKRGGYRAGGLAWRTPFVIAGVLALGAAGLWVAYETRPVLNTDGPAPRLVFEVRLPPGLAPADGVNAELHTEKNRMPALISREPPRMVDGRAVIAGSVELYYRSGWRLLEVKMPGQDDRLFRLGLPANPRRSTEFGGWERAQFTAAPGLSQPRKAGREEAFEIRYRVIWAE